MRSILTETVLAVGLTLASAVPTFAAPAYCPAISQAAASVSAVTQARCWCRRVGLFGRCRVWACW
jgi:hypothetical protein